MATRTISVAGGNYDNALTWVEGFVPTDSDDVVATALSGNLTINVDSLARSVNLTGYVGTLTHNNFSWSIGDDIGGDLIIPSGITYVADPGSIIRLVAGGGAPVAVVLDVAAITIKNLYFQGELCTYTFNSNVNVTADCLLHFGTINANNKNVSANLISVGAFASLSMKAGIFTCVAWENQGSVTNQGTSTITFTGIGSCVLGTGNKFYNVNFNSTFIVLVDLFDYTNNLVIDGGIVIQVYAAGGLYFNAAKVTINSSVGNTVEFMSDSGPTQATIFSGTNAFSYVKATDMLASPGIITIDNGTDGGNNTNWIFTSAVASNDAIFFAGN